MTEDDLNDLDQEQLNDERLRRMKALMRQLYRDEFETKRFKVPPIKGKTMILFISFVSIVLFGVTTLYNYNRFVTLEEHILSNKGHVSVAMQNRTNLFTNLFNLALNHAEVEREVFHYVADARSEINGGTDKRGVAKPEGVVKGVLDSKLPTVPGSGATVMPGVVSRLLAIVEQYPDIKSSQTYRQLMETLVTMEARVVKRRNATNEAIRVYNTLISTFPWYLLSKAVGFHRYGYYQFDASDTLLSADVFERLLPVVLSRGQKAAPLPAVTEPRQPAAAANAAELPAAAEPRQPAAAANAAELPAAAELRQPAAAANAVEPSKAGAEKQP